MLTETSGGLMTVLALPQIVYLDFDGELTSYNGEILTIDEVSVDDSKLTKERIAAITKTLNEQFATQNVRFVSDKSDLSDQSDYSTVYIGKTTAFASYGNGDALFVDDIYSAFPDEEQVRLAQIDEIRAGAGVDVVDLTSQRFSYTNGVTIRGGDGADTIGANKGENMLFGDSGNDRLVGCFNDDVIAGGSGNDSINGGGGNDIFCFCKGWGNDTVEQLANGTVTLWFESQTGTWDQSTMTYSDGTNSVKVSGVSSVTLKYGDDGSGQYDELAAAGAFLDASSFNIFEDKDNDVIASI